MPGASDTIHSDAADNFFSGGQTQPPQLSLPMASRKDVDFLVQAPILLISIWVENFLDILKS
jgi:hypothetical protein